MRQVVCRKCLHTLLKHDSYQFSFILIISLSLFTPCMVYFSINSDTKPRNYTIPRKIFETWPQADFLINSDTMNSILNMEKTLPTALSSKMIQIFEYWEGQEYLENPFRSRFMMNSLGWIDSVSIDYIINEHLLFS